MSEETKTNYEWDPEDPRCVCCGDVMRLNDGCEWDEDPTMNLCHPCTLGALEDARKLSLAPSSTSAVVLTFARKMEAQLQANMAKGDREAWKARSPDKVSSTLADLAEETWQLSPLVARNDPESAERAVDLANYALMLADACGALEEVK